MLSQTEKAFLFFVTIGALSLLITICTLARFLALHLRTTSIKKYNKNHNSWALITGSSDGIGEALAHELCSHGFNLILHGRNPTKLSSVKTKLSSSFPNTKFLTFIADATASTSANAAAIKDLLTTIKDLPLTVLINNVGGTSPMKKAFTTFATHTSQEVDALISLNMLFTLHLTHAFLPILSRQDSALIMNTGSTSKFGMPYLPIYSPTKAYLTSWTNALSIEFQAEGLSNIEVLTVESGNTQTGQDKREANLFRPAARTLAKAAIGKVGCGESVVVGYFWHAVQTAVVGWLPEGWQRLLLISVMRPMKGMNLDDQA